MLEQGLCCMFDCLHHIKEFYMYIAFTQSGIDNEIYFFFSKLNTGAKDASESHMNRSSYTQHKYW